MTSSTSPADHLITASPKSPRTALFLCVLLGAIGAHRFYVGKFTSGLLNLCTGGFLGLWVLIDLIVIIRSQFKDKQGHPLLFKKKPSFLSSAALLLGAITSWLVLTLSLVLFWGHYLTAALVNVVSNQLEALKKRDYATAYSYTSTEYQNIFTLDTFELWVLQYPVLLDHPQMNFSKQGFNSSAMDSGFLEGTFKASNGETLFIRYQLIKQQGQWKISNIIPNPKN